MITIEEKLVDDNLNGTLGIKHLLNCMGMDKTKCSGTLYSTPCDMQDCGHWDYKKGICRIEHKLTIKDVASMVDRAMNNIAGDLAYGNLRKLKYPIINFKRIKQLLERSIKNYFKKGR